MEKYGKTWNRIGEGAFFLGVMIEVVLMLLETSRYIIQYPTLWFRLAFLLFAVKVLTTKYSKKEMLCIVLFGLLGLGVYLGSGREEVIRIVVFAAAFKNLDWKKVLRAVFFTTLAGCILLMLLAVTGIFGDIALTEEFRNGIEETRYTLGFGHPNALHCFVWALSTLWITLYFEKIRWYHIAVLMGVNTGFYLLTDSRTGFMVATVTLLTTMFFVYCKKQREKKWPYILGAAALIACVLLAFLVSLYGYGWNRGMWNSLLVDKIDFTIFSARFRYAYFRADLSTWHLFGSPLNERYFDMGIVRLFYWYGIVAGLVYMSFQILLVGYAREKVEYGIYILVTMFAFYHIFEAHAISVFIARNYTLFLIGATWNQLLKVQSEQEEYWWKCYRLLFQK